MIGLGIEPEGFVGSREPVEPSHHLFGPEKDVLARGEDKTGRFDPGGDHFARIDQLSKAVDKAKCEGRDVVRSILDAEGVFLIAGDPQRFQLPGDEPGGIKSHAGNGRRKKADGLADDPRRRLHKIDDGRGKNCAAHGLTKLIVSQHPGKNQRSHALAADPKRSFGVMAMRGPRKRRNVPGDVSEVEGCSTPAMQRVEALSSQIESETRQTRRAHCFPKRQKVRGSPA